ncbi:fused response regulator/phosphatase [Phormidesmis priestleyi ULC007]|uniref:Fused response regulator/phosphatase n=2 Tax=Phormidesmis priestleyi TaxID=268141 RepID=A0A2T1DF20_9CYAN|nr:SpoIIE family protein phosphatase [Phormidesmis priestleyi]PSB19120.1 fused response regulator/phosphatase [Phormidesmis priestleyi ULC007]PZO49972.1 MAG: fused response regulator/phosphatase [Phormidesmis priestleyi]
MGRETKPKLKLMIVDDEPDNLDLLYRTFRRDFEVVRATSAIAALKILDQQGEMAIIISDQRMPEMLGTEFLSKTVDRFPDTIRIVLTGYTDVEDLVDAINAGKVFKYITKPWKPQQLQVVIEQAAETYGVLKQRTADLQRALRRESLFNAVTTAIRESLDYPSMLQTIVETLGQTFGASHCVLHPVEGKSIVAESLLYCLADCEPISEERDRQDPMVQAALKTRKTQVGQSPKDADMRLVVPLTYQQELLAILSFYQGSSEQAGADLFHPPWSKEDIQLLEGVAEQAALAISQAKLYQRTQKQAEQIRAELAVARQIQTNLLRQTLPILETVKVQACCHPAREVGGDFFEVYQHPQGDVWLAVGDVSGKGVPAALFMASAISVLRRELSQETPPEPNVVMQNLNSILSQDLVSTNCFITMVLARYSPIDKQLVYANAGHIYPVVWARQTGASQSEQAVVEPIYLKVRGVPLGILPEWNAIAGNLTLHSGEVLLLTSDGITEAIVPSEDLTGHTPTNGGKGSSMLKEIGLWQLLLQERECLDLNHLLARIQSHNAIQEDDQTILSLEVL